MMTMQKVTTTVNSVLLAKQEIIRARAATTAAFQNGSGLNTEHAWPQTFGADALPARADMHHLYASRVNVNTDRGNLPFKDIPDNDTDRWYYLNQLLNNPPTSTTARAKISRH